MISAAAIKAKARDVGFDACGIARADRFPRLARLSSWIDEGCAGEMTYLAESLDERLDARAFLPTARSVISVACVYHSSATSLDTTSSVRRAHIARYARGDDYHDVMRARLRALVTWLAGEMPGLEALTCVDDGPVQERVYAEQAGIGWIGKNTCVISPSLGSWMVLGEIVTNADLEPDAPAVDQCGTCTRCLDACPTGAITAPYTVDATRCLSYLTIEVRGAVVESHRAAIREEIFGCDICQDVCPWNRRAATSDDPAWRPRAAAESASIVDWCRRPDGEWRAVIRGSALRRAGLRRLRRSLAYAAASLESPERAVALDALASHPSGTDALVADAIAWARTR